MLEPYTDKPDIRGTMLIEEDALMEVVKEVFPCLHHVSSPLTQLVVRSILSNQHPRYRRPRRSRCALRFQCRPDHLLPTPQLRLFTRSPRLCPPYLHRKNTT